ncbi:hypothetical protein CCHR01_12913 [Colletotrichum chrysophilum]|uniref:Uncharacterized protein n=1 Tax=Colletotrichum chrysophilum TaxID=1836956 RepID=A0AAD9EDF4_9PEZI|nr:hypothetical protein CCHR01_12913 [Colletotrichum chrysophilum]
MCTALYLVTSLGADLPVSSFYSGLPYFHRSPFTRLGYSHPSTALFSKAIFPVGHRPSPHPHIASRGNPAWGLPDLVRNVNLTTHATYCSTSTASSISPHVPIPSPSPSPSPSPFVPQSKWNGKTNICGTPGISCNVLWWLLCDRSAGLVYMHSPWCMHIVDRSAWCKVWRRTDACKGSAGR